MKGLLPWGHRETALRPPWPLGVELPVCPAAEGCNSPADPHMLSLPQGPRGPSLLPARRSSHCFPCSPFHRLWARPARPSQPGSLHSTSVFAHQFSQTLLEAPEARRHPRRRLWGPRASTARPLPRGMFPFPAPTPRAEAPARPPAPPSPPSLSLCSGPHSLQLRYLMGFRSEAQACGPGHAGPGVGSLSLAQWQVRSARPP